MPTHILTLTDTYQRVSDLAGLRGQGAALADGVLQPQSNGVELVLGAEVVPTSDGITLAVGQSLGWGPTTTPEEALPFETLWARNAVSGSNATLVILGRLVRG